MLRPRWRKVLRDAWLHKARTALVVLAIAIGILGAGSALNTWSMLRRVTRDGYFATNPASATITTERIDDSLLARIRTLPEIGAAEARRTVIGRARIDGAWRTAVLFAPADPAAITIGTVATESGWPPRDSALTVERSSVEYAGAEVGRPIEIQVGDSPPVPLPVTGFARDQGLAPGWMEHVVYAFVTPGTLARLGSAGTFDQLRIVVRDRQLDRDGVRRITGVVQRAIEATGRSVRSIDVPEPGEHIHAGQMNSLLFTQGAFGLLALLLSGLLVVNLIAAMLAGQVREIGVMKAIGARSVQVARMYLALAFVLGAVACLIAIPAAAMIGRGYAGFIGEMLNFETRGYGIPIWSFGLQVLVGLILPVIAAAVPVRRGCRISVGAALRDVGIDDTATRTPGPVPGWLRGLSRPILLSLRNAFRRRQRMALTLVTLATGGGVFLGALNLRVGIQRSVAHLYGETMRWDLVLRFREAHTVDSLEAAVRSVAGVQRAEAWTGVRAAVSRPEGTLGATFQITGLPVGSTLVGFTVMEGRWLVAGDTGIVVSERLLKEEPGLRVGEVATLIIRGVPVRRPVVGVVNAGPGPGAYADRAAVMALAGTGRVQTLMVVATSREPGAQAELSRRLRPMLDDAGMPVAEGQLMAEARKVLEDHMLVVVGTLLMLARLMIVVGGLGLASTMSLAVLERTREIGVLRAIGARHGAIHAMIQTEGLVIGIASWLVAIPISVPLSLILGRIFGKIMIEVPASYAPEWSGVAQWLAVVVLVSIAACAWPAFRATRIPTARALAYE